MNIIVYIGSLLLFFACSTKQNERQSPITNSVQTPVAAPPTATTKPPTTKPNAVADAGKWVYEKQVDKEGRTVHKASTRSPTQLKTAFPYTGNSIATLTIRKRVSSDTHLYIQVSNGQFNRSFVGGQARIRFDNGASKLYSFSAAENGTANIIFFDTTQPLIQKLKTTRTMLVNVEFAGLGYQQIEFKTAGLSWNH